MNKVYFSAKYSTLQSLNMLLYADGEKIKFKWILLFENVFKIFKRMQGKFNRRANLFGNFNAI